MSDVQVYKGGARAAVVERMQPGGILGGATLREQFEVATAIANATEAVPKGYRKQPGAVLLALAWAQQHDLDVLTTMQGVAFIEGRAVVDATMQRALAKRAGYELRIGLREDAATVEVLQHGEGLGAATYSMADAERAGLLGKNNWRQNPEDMLVARATTRAVRRFAPDVLIGLTVSDDLDEDAPTPPEQPPAVAAAFPPPFAAEHGVEAATPVEVPEEADPPSAPAADPPRGVEASVEVPAASAEVGRTWGNVDTLRAELRERGITNREAVEAAQAIAEELGEQVPGAMVNVLKASDELRSRFASWVRGHGLAG